MLNGQIVETPTVWRNQAVKNLSRLALFLFWPALALVAWGELTPHPPPVFAHVWDKALHFTAYFGLAGLAAVMLRSWRAAAWAVLGLIVLGGMLEILQGFTGRDPDVLDEVANTLGAISGALAGWGVVWLLMARPLVEGAAPD